MPLFPQLFEGVRLQEVLELQEQWAHPPGSGVQVGAQRGGWRRGDSAVARAQPPEGMYTFGKGFPAERLSRLPPSFQYCGAYLWASTVNPQIVNPPNRIWMRLRRRSCLHLNDALPCSPCLHSAHHRQIGLGVPNAKRQ